MSDSGVPCYVNAKIQLSNPFGLRSVMSVAEYAHGVATTCVVVVLVVL